MGSKQKHSPKEFEQTKWWNEIDTQMADDLMQNSTKRDKDETTMKTKLKPELRKIVFLASMIPVR